MTINNVAPQTVTNLAPIVAGIKVPRPNGEFDRSMFQKVRYIVDNRSPKSKKEPTLPVNPTRYTVQRVDRCQSQLYNERRERPTLKKNVNLWDGYVRLFGAETDNLEHSLPRDRR